MVNKAYRMAYRNYDWISWRVSSVGQYIFTVAKSEVQILDTSSKTKAPAALTMQFCLSLLFSYTMELNEALDKEP